MLTISIFLISLSLFLLKFLSSLQLQTTFPLIFTWSLHLPFTNIFSYKSIATKYLIQFLITSYTFLYYMLLSVLLPSFLLIFLINPFVRHFFVFFIHFFCILPVLAAAPDMPVITSSPKIPTYPIILFFIVLHTVP